jgi:UDP-N-acetylmuramoyl-L-alanyl-D-glutamate--2,6-diaminopimelate ligase
VTSGSGREDALAELIASAEPKTPRRLGELIERLEAEGRMRTVLAPERPRDAASAARVAVGSMPIRGLTFDSRRVTAGSIFVAVPGEHVDGHDYVPAAVALGAAAVIVERPLAGVATPQIVVDRAQAALAVAAAWWYGDPSRELGVVGITGTDGKTTTSFLATAVLEAAEISTGLLTTAELKVGELRSANPEHVTTPEAPQLQRTLRAMVVAGNRAAIVETTSHGLALDRVGGVAYDIAIFTNLTHEHLELHGTFEAYREAKLSLFRRLGVNVAAPKELSREWPRTAIVNHDDPSSPLFVEAAESAGAARITYGVAPAADVCAVGVEEDARRLRLRVRTPRWVDDVTVRLVGRFNVYNVLAAIALGEALELDPAAVRAGLAGVRGVPGRMERVDCGQPFGVIVDYAHSPASLQTVLDQLAPLAAAGSGLIAVFGSAGERDVQKRPMMGRIAGERCRLVIVTDEDPRGESREAILDEIAAGAEAAGKRRGEDLLVIPDRREAVATAFEQARPGDMVVLAGKGHEQSIIMSNGPRAWDERTEAIAALGLLGFRHHEHGERDDRNAHD